MSRQDGDNSMGGDPLQAGSAPRPVDPAQAAFESVFDSMATLYRETGGIPHQLIGLEFRAGRAHDAHIEFVKVPEKVPVLIERMARKWHTVAHIRVSPGTVLHAPGAPRPERRTLAAIEIHGAGGMALAMCRVNKATREIMRGALTKAVPGV